MAHTILLRRGAVADLPSLAVGEPAFTTDTKALYIGSATGNIQFVGAASGGANPTGTIGLAAVNGSATTWLRSDGAPALSQAITPTWTGKHIWQLTTEQVRIGYDANNYATCVVGAAGALTLTTVDASAAAAHIALMPDGNVGIGTTSPGYTLDVTYSEDISSYNQLRIVQRVNFKDSSGGAWYSGMGAGLAFSLEGQTGGPENLAAIYGAGEDDPLTNGSLRFQTLKADVLTEQMRITSQGLVGIGTTSPSAALHVLKATEQARLGYDASNYAAFTVGSAGAMTVALTGTNSDLTLTPVRNVVITDAKNIAFGTTTGSQIGTAAAQKIGFFGATPVIQRAKASYNNWAALGDVVNALVALGLFDAA